MEYRWQGQWTLWLFCGPQCLPTLNTMRSTGYLERVSLLPSGWTWTVTWEARLLGGLLETPWSTQRTHTHTHCMHIHACFMQTHEETHATHSKARAESTDEATTCRRGFILPTLRESRERIGSVLILRCQSQYKTDFLLVSKKVRNAGRKVWSNSNLVTVAVAVTS